MMFWRRYLWLSNTFHCELKETKIKQFLFLYFSAPDFVSSLEDKDHVYFFFREAAVEYINCGKVNWWLMHLVSFYNKNIDSIFKKYDIQVQYIVKILKYINIIILQDFKIQNISSILCQLVSMNICKVSNEEHLLLCFLLLATFYVSTDYPHFLR